MATRGRGGGRAGRAWDIYPVSHVGRIRRHLSLLLSLSLYRSPPLSLSLTLCSFPGFVVFVVDHERRRRPGSRTLLEGRCRGCGVPRREWIECAAVLELGEGVRTVWDALVEQ